MNPKEIRELMKDKYEEVTHEEYFDGHNTGECAFYLKNDKLYFKPKEQFPIVFNDNLRKVEVNYYGILTITDHNGFTIEFNESLPILYNAVEKSKELRK